MLYTIETFIKKYTGAFLVLACGIGLLFPQLAVFKELIFYILLLLLFCSFLKVDFRPDHFINPKLLLYPLFNWIILPAIVFFTTKSLINDYRIGLLFAVITPPALGSPVIISVTKGDLEFMMSNVVIYNLLSPLTYSFIPTLLLKGEEIEVPTVAILARVLVVVFIPMALALLVKRHKMVKVWIVENIDTRKNVLQIFMVMVAVASASLKIRETPINEVFYLFLAMFFTTFILYAIGYLSTKNPVMQRTLPVAIGQKNTLLSIMICVGHFSPIAAIPTVFYLISHHIMNGVLIQITSKKVRNSL